MLGMNAAELFDRAINAAFMHNASDIDPDDSFQILNWWLGVVQVGSLYLIDKIIVFLFLHVCTLSYELYTNRIPINNANNNNN